MRSAAALSVADPARRGPAAGTLRLINGVGGASMNLEAPPGNLVRLMMQRTPWTHPFASFAASSQSGDIEAVRVHHLVPGLDEIGHELLLGVGLRVNLCDGA